MKLPSYLHLRSSKRDPDNPRRIIVTISCDTAAAAAAFERAARQARLQHIRRNGIE